MSSQKGKKSGMPAAKPVAGAALAASFRRFPAANLHVRLAATATKR